MFKLTDEEYLIYVDGKFYVIIKMAKSEKDTMLVANT